MSLNIEKGGKKRVVIVGGGFSGLNVAKRLRRSGFQIVLIDRNNYHQFPPLIYQVASAGMEPSSISFPFRKIFAHRPDVYFRMAELRAVFPEKKIIQTSIGKVDYDYLVLAAGATTNFYGNKNVAAEAMPMKTVAEAMGKSVFMYLFDQYIADYPLFTMHVVRSVSEVLDRLDDMYKVKGIPAAVTESRARSLDFSKAGRAGDFIYQSPVTARMVEEVLNIAKYDCNVIIQGETGTGKEKILSLIHENSERHGMPCIKINCATIHENLAESEFFGYEPGSFTGASATGKKGYFEMADNGILFLDEIGSLPFSMQSKLLRVLQENTFYRVGGTKQITVNVRVVAANNVPLRELVAAGTFREDLFYRLNICCIDVPPLRNRREDIICLAESFVKGWSKKYNVTRKLSAGALDVLYRYDWPGNVRELENVVHRLVISATGSTISASSTARILSESAGDDAFTVAVDLEERNRVDFHEIMERQEKQLIEYAIRKGGTTRKAADILGLPQTTFARKKLKYGL